MFVLCESKDFLIKRGVGGQGSGVSSSDRGAPHRTGPDSQHLTPDTSNF